MPAWPHPAWVGADTCKSANMVSVDTIDPMQQLYHPAMHAGMLPYMHPTGE